MTTNQTLQLRLREEKDLIACEKMPGLNTHAPDIGKAGLAEILGAVLGREIFVVHRLDKATSGLMFFALTRDAAARLGTLFEDRAVKKRYILLTAKSSKTSFEVSSFIDKKGDAFVSDPKKESNSRTRFSKIRSLSFGDLWEAFPETGKPHQIRLHAADEGLPILGDTDHGGAPFFRLALHAQSLAFDWDSHAISWEATMPVWSEEHSVSELVLLDAIRTRLAFYDVGADECLRLVHDEMSACTIDQYGPQWVVSWYRDLEPSPLELKFFETLSSTFAKPIFIRKMQNKGQDPNAKTTWSLGAVNERWQATEAGVKFDLRLDSGQSPGLFLDQRENRAWVRSAASGKKVLNLFSYTAGFSVNAALGGATEVCTVDVSGNFNSWGKENFKLNNLDPARAGYEFWNQDCMLFMKGAVKRGRKWDLICCDPPSFGRSKEGVFQIQKNLAELLDLCVQSLNPGGRMLFSTNYEQWSLDDLRELISKQLKSKITLQATPIQGLDFEKPGAPSLMKSVIVQR